LGPEVELGIMKTRHAELSASSDQSSEAAMSANRSSALYDIVALQILRGHDGEGAAVDLAQAASRRPAYREELQYQSERLGLQLPVRIAGQAVDLDLPLAADPRDKERRADVERRAGDLQQLGEELGKSAASEMVGRDLAALRETATPEDRLAIAVAMDGSAAIRLAYAQALESADREISTAVARTQAQADALSVRVQAGQSMREGESGKAKLDPILTRGVFASEKASLAG
jgi:hypothetical protein